MRSAQKITATYDPGILHHIAIIPDRKKCFVLMIPKGMVKTFFEPVYRWIPMLIPVKK